MKRYVRAERQLLTYDGPLPEPQVELSDDEIKEWLSRELIGIHNAAIENIIRTALFDSSSVIDWQNVYREILRQNPQFRGVLEDNSDNSKYRW